MSDHLTHPTPYPGVNIVIQEVLSSVQAVLGNQFVGMYLYGSLASGDFDPQHSDIDFVVVTADELPDELIRALEAMHVRIGASGLKWAPKLEGSYISRRALRRYDETDAPRPQLNDGKFYVDRHHSDWIIQRHILRENGVVLAGTAPQTLIDPVQPDDLRRGVRGILHSWWSQMLHDPAQLQKAGYQAYAVLTMCRALYTLKHGTVASKPVSARWAQRELGEQWEALIAGALSSLHGEQFDKLDETLDFIRYTLERSQH
jgi:predicted nucleotidyltransferase